MISSNNIDLETIGTGKKKFAIITLVHGDETETLDIVRILKQRFSEEDKKIFSFYIIKANKNASKENKRFLDADLNRVFPGKKEGNREEKLAYMLTDFLSKMDFVLDLHTTPAITEPFFIITKKDQSIIDKINKRGIKKLCIMSPEVASGKALIDYCKGVSLEINKNDDMNLITPAILRLIRDEKTSENFEVFEVIDIIRKEIFGVRNFEKNKLIGTDLYPVLYGETDYDFVCLAAKKMS